jgi:hypothetical protein
MITHTFPAGKYYIGDPCYVVRDGSWGKLIDETGCFGLDLDGKNWDDGKFTYRGKFCFAAGTAYGDGCYTDHRGGEYPVDAGLIGILPVEVCVKKNLKDGRVVDFTSDFEVYEFDGVFHFGHVKIDTN